MLILLWYLWVLEKAPRLLTVQTVSRVDLCPQKDGHNRKHLGTCLQPGAPQKLWFTLDLFLQSETEHISLGTGGHLLSSKTQQEERQPKDLEQLHGEKHPPLGNNTARKDCSLHLHLVVISMPLEWSSIFRRCRHEKLSWEPNTSYGTRPQLSQKDAALELLFYPDFWCPST